MAPYPERVDALILAGVAVWDVLRACVRPGSLELKMAAWRRWVQEG